jgi:hypothetical protein
LHWFLVISSTLLLLLFYFMFVKNLLQILCVLGLLYITSKFRIITIFIAVDLETMFPT